MAYNNIETRQLAIKIEERKRFIARVVNFVESMVLDYGEVTLRVEGPSSIHVVKKLANFSSFLFIADWGQTTYGGNDIKIWYNHNVMSEINPFKTLPVLHVYYQPARFNVNECLVRHFDEGEEWQNAIERTIRNRNRLIAKMKTENKEPKKTTQQIAATGKERLKLEEDAKRLGI